MRKKYQPDVAVYLETNKNHFDKISNGDNGILKNKYSENPQKTRFHLLTHPYCNSIISDLPTEHHYMNIGSKKLFYITHLSDKIKLISFHFSLNRKTRQKQFNYFKKYISEQPEHFIVCGDFNIFKGIKELKSLTESLNIVSIKPTFPSHKPSHPLDLFLIDPQIKVSKHIILDEIISDHRAVLLEIET